MGLFDYERAKKAYDKEPVGNINKMMSSSNFTKYDELKTSDHRVSFEFKRLNENIEKIIEIIESRYE